MALGVALGSPKEWVSAGFMKPAIAELGVTRAAYAALVGVSAQSISTYLKDNRAPSAVAAATNGLIAQKRLGGNGAIRNLPAIIAAKTTANKSVRVTGKTIDQASLTIGLSADELPRAKALLAACGYEIIGERKP